MQELEIIPKDINDLDDISKLPFTTKKDLRDNYPFELNAVPRRKIVRTHASSGTTDKPTVVGYTRKFTWFGNKCQISGTQNIERSVGKAKRVINKRQLK